MKQEDFTIIITIILVFAIGIAVALCLFFYFNKPTPMYPASPEDANNQINMLKTTILNKNYILSINNVSI